MADEKGVVADFPQRPEVDLDRVPAELKKLPRWVVWRYESRKQSEGLKYVKPPYHPSGRRASATDPRDWSSFEEVSLATESGKWHGIGLVLDGSDDLVAWDLDHVIDQKSGELLPWADRLLKEVDSYTEVSPSGEGVRVVARGRIPEDGKKKAMPGRWPGQQPPALECYRDKRYVTITGMVMGSAREPRHVEGMEQLWRRLFTSSPEVKKALKSERLKKLASGDLSDYGGDHSAADSAFCILIADKLGRDPAKIDEAIRQTGLYRPKWDEVHGGDGRTYGQMTIQDAIEKASSMKFTPKHSLTDTGNAQRFVALHGHEVRHSQDGWYAWDGRRLERDELGRVHLMTKDVAADLASEVEPAQVDEDAAKAVSRAAKDAESRRSRDNIMALAAVEPPIPIDVDELDSRNDLFCCKNVVVKDGREALPHRFDYLITKSSPTNYIEDAEAPMWRRFLGEVFPDAEIRDYVQRIVGYSMTGDVSEQEFYFCHGSGANGKSAFFECLAEVLGDYFTDLPTSVLMESKYQEHPTGIMALRGVRLALASEVGEGKRLNEELIKAATGESRLTARRMRQDYITFRNTAKLWIMGNHRPSIRGTDDAIWRRVKVIPFTQVIPEGSRVKHLGKIIGRTEAEGVLAWACEGWREWAGRGMRTPSQVRVAVQEYREEMDQVKVFISEECELAPDATLDMTVLHARYTRWAEGSREHVLSVKAMSMRLQEKGFEPFRNTHGRRAWRGLRLKEPLTTDDIPF